MFGTTESFRILSAGLFGAGLFSAFMIIIFAFLLVIILTLAILYVYNALVWSTIAKKQKYDKSWLAWIPVVQFFLLPILASKNWAWGFIIFTPVVLLPMFVVPLVGHVLSALTSLFILGMSIYWCWIIFEKRNYAGWLSVFQAIPLIGKLIYLVTIGFVAWSKEPLIPSEKYKISKKKIISKKKAKK